MDAGQIEVFLRRAGCEKIKRTTEWVKSTCPVARWAHSGGRDARPSFAVRIVPGGESRCKCLGCGYSGPLYPLAWKLGFPELLDLGTRNNAPDLSGWDEEEAVFKAVSSSRVEYWSSVSSMSRKVTPLEKRSENPTLGESELEAFSCTPSFIRRIVESRGVTEESMKLWELGLFARGNRMAIPIRREDGKLVGISGRAMGGQEPKYLHSKGFQRDLVLYGEHMVVPGKTGYLCEGFFQAIAITQVGIPNAVARMGTHLSKWQVEKIRRWFPKLVIVADGDEAGRKSAELIRASLGMSMPVEIVDVPDGMDADSLGSERLKSLLFPPQEGVDNPKSM